MNRVLVGKLRAFFKRQNDVQFAYLFGSNANGTAGKLSDVDVAVYLKPSISKKEYLTIKLRLISDLVQACGTDRVDLTILNESALHLNNNVVANGVLLASSNEKERARFESSTISRFMARKPVLERRSAAVIRRVARVGLA